MTLLGQLAHDLADRNNKAQIEHVIGLVEHDDAGLLKPHVAALHMVEQTARRGHQHVDAARKRLDLRAKRHAANDAGDTDAHGAAIGAEAVGDLDGQFASRRHDKRTRMARLGGTTVFEEALQNRQSESRRLAGAGLGDAKQILALQQERDRLGLNWGGGRIALFGKRAEDRLGKAEISKRRHVRYFHMRRNPRVNARLAGSGDGPRVTGLSMGMTLGLYGWTVWKNGLRDRSSLLLRCSVVWVGCLGGEVKDVGGGCGGSVAFNFNH